MSDNYVPTTDEVRFAYGAFPSGEESIVSHNDAVAENLAEFDRWLAAHDRQEREKAWDRCADDAYTGFQYESRPANPYRMA